MRKNLNSDITESEEMKEMEERNEDTETLFEMTLKDVRNYISATRLNLGKVRHFQFMQGADASKVPLLQVADCRI